jgi:hypothetical protein
MDDRTYEDSADLLQTLQEFCKVSGRSEPLRVAGWIG